jgi:hypothetical protein
MIAAETVPLKSERSALLAQHLLLLRDYREFQFEGRLAL